MTIIESPSRLHQKNLKYEDFSWDFKSADTKDLTHCFHNYPAMMIPQIPRRILDKYGLSAKILFDPYCGSGTSLVEANMKNINAIGADLNPLARLIARAKTTPIDIRILDFYLEDFHDHFLQKLQSVALPRVVLPQFHNIDFWFHKKIQKKLALIKRYIEDIPDSKVKNFFLIAFSETVRQSSLTRKGEFKLIRIPEDQRKSFNPDSFKIMSSALLRNRSGLLSYMKQKKNKSVSRVYAFNTVRSIPKRIVPNASVDIVVTSPPYGDSRTTVAYGQYSRLASQWIGIEKASEVDKNLMGGVKYNSDFVFPSGCLQATLEKIGRVDLNRKLEVQSFFIDYNKSISNVAKTLKKRGIACYVVGNRTVKGINIPTDVITKDFFESHGFQHLETIIRNIPNKRMPSQNSPSNVPGKKSTTMKNEFIVICEKTK